MLKSELIKQIDLRVKECRKCRLFKGTIHAVPGEGNINSEIVFIGEAPGANEDRTGRPFVGRAGALLEKLLFEINYKREQVWIGNIIKHRPPENRDPLPDEISSCEGFLDAQLKVIAPKLIITLGRFAMNYFYPAGKISLVHGVLIKTYSYSIYPLYHPAAALRSSTVDTDLHNDFLRIPSILDEVKRIKDFPKSNLGL